MVSALLLLAAISTCEGHWAPYCEMLTYDGMDAEKCLEMDAEGYCKTSKITEWGHVEGLRRSSLLPDCPRGLSFLELAKRHQACKIPAERLRLAPVPGSDWAD